MTLKIEAAMLDSHTALPGHDEISIPNASVVVGLGLVAYIMYKWIRSRSVPDTPWPKVPGARPIFGNDIGGLENLSSRIAEWARKYGQETGIYEFVMFGRRFIVPCTEANIKLIENERPYSFTRPVMLRNGLNSLGFDGLFSAEGDQWSKDRKMVGPALNRKNIRDYLATIKLVTQRLLEKWHSHANEGHVVSINDDILASTIDIISLVAFSKDVDSLRGDDSNMSSDLKKMLRIGIVRALSPFCYWRIPIVGQYLDGAGFARSRIMRSFSALVDNYEASPMSNGIEANHFLAKVVALRKKDSTALSRYRLVGNIMTLFAAGAETTFVTMCSALYEIAIDRTGLQEELAEEALLMNDFDEADLEELTKDLPRLRSLIYETLRIRGPVELIGATNTANFELDGVVLPPRTVFLMPGQYISTLESKDGGVATPRGILDASPTEFCSRRWLSNDEDASGGKLTVETPSFRTGFRAFGAGKRVCPGRDLSEVEMLVILSSILRTFEISLEEGHPPMKLITRFASTPDSNIRLVLKPRKIGKYSAP